MKKRIMSALLAAAMAFTLLPAAAWAATPTAGESGVSQERTEIPLDRPRDGAPAVEDVPVSAEIPADDPADAEAQIDAADEPLSAPAAPLALTRTAGADEPFLNAGGDGMEDSPYEIATLEQLEAFRDYVNAGHNCEDMYIKLTANIDMSDKYSEDGTSWTPIGTISNSFNGEFDGAGHTVNVSLSYTDSTVYYVGLFGLVYTDAVISNLSVSGSISSMNDNAAVGGIAGDIYGHIESCYSSVNITGKGSIGGIAGRSTIGHIINSYNTGNITNSSARNDHGTGGIVGDNYEWIESCYNTGKITLAEGGAAAVGGIAGTGNSGTVSNCYYLTGTAEKGVGVVSSDGYCTVENVEEKNTEEFKTLASALNDDWGDVWKDSSLLGRPVFTALPESGDGTEAAPYTIPNLATLEAVRDYINAGNGSGEYFKLTDNIDMSTTYGEDKGEDGTSWTPIGAYLKPFNGIFDGGGFTISGLYIKYVAGDYTGYKGLFREIDTEGEVKNLTVSGSISGYETVGGIAGDNEGVISNCHNKCTVNGTRSYVGGIVGQNSGGSIENCDNTGAVSGAGILGGIVGSNVLTSSIENCHNTGTVSGSGNYIGGIVGENNGTCSIKNCYNTGTISGKYVGGIAGTNYEGNSIENCYNTGEVSGTGNYAGGIAGNDMGSIKSCYNTGTVSGSDRVGGIAGNDYYGGTFENCYNAGTVSGSGEYIGGIVGYHGSSGSSIENCYYLNTCGAEGQGTAKTEDAFHSGEVAYLLQNGQDAQTWGQTVGAGYPELTGEVEKKVYQITGVVEDPDSIVWYSNREATLPAEPSKAGFIFVGWATEEGGPADFEKGLPVSGDMTVYAVWKFIFEGAGTELDPYRIPDLATLEAFRDYINAGNGGGEYFKLTDDIDMSTTYGEDKGEGGTSWTPIGTFNMYSEDGSFQGIFDGGGHTISGLYLNATGEETSVGLFGGNTGTICDLKVSGTILTRDDGSSAGEIVGTNAGTVSGCTSAGSVTIVDAASSPFVFGAGGMAGGVVGANMGLVTDCDSSAHVAATVNDDSIIICAVGGIVGINRDLSADVEEFAVKNCRFSGEVTGSISGDGDIMAGFGGIMGMTMVTSESAVEGCANAGRVSGSIGGVATMAAGVGGIVGTNLAEGGATRVKNCVNTGAVSVETAGGAGGIVGVNLSADPAESPAVVERCYNTGVVTGTGAVPGAVVGINAMESADVEEPVTMEGQVVNCYYLSGGADGIGAGEGEAEAKTEAQFASGEVTWLLQKGQETQAWGQTVGVGYPELTDSAEKTVYKVTFATSAQPEYAAQYANHNGTVELPAEPTLDGTAFDHWSTVDSASGGSKFDNTTQVTGDVTVHAVGQNTFGGESDEITLTTTYGTALTEDLSEHMAYQLGTEPAGKFAYEITAGNDALNATIEGDILTIPGTANAESYTLTIVATEKEPAYSLMSVASYGTADVTLTVKVTIDKAAATVTAPTANAGLTYTGAPQALIAAGNVTGDVEGYGTMQYSLEAEGDFDAAIPTGTDAKTYTVYWTVDGADETNYNYSDEISGQVTVTIARAQALVTEAPTPVTAPYTGEAITLVSGGASNFGSLAYSLTEAGPFTATATAVNAGTYTVYYKVEGTDNWTASEVGSVQATIEKVASSATAPTAKALTYTGAAQALVEAGTATGGTIKYALGDAAPSDEDQWKTDASQITGTDAGDYSVWYKVVGDANHTDAAPVQLTATIERAAATVKAPTANDDLTYTGAAQALIAPGGVTCDAAGCGEVWYSLEAGGGFSAEIPTGEDAGTYTVYWLISRLDRDNYAYSPATNGEVEVTIHKAQATVTVAPTPVTATYTGEEITLVSGGESNFGTLVYSLAEEGPFTGDVPAETEAGTYTVYYMVEGTDNWNASDVGHVQAAIKKAASSATVAGSTGLVYSGEPQALVASGTSETGTVLYALGESASAVPGDGYTEDIPTGTDAGTYYVWWKVLGDVDHSDSAPACLAVTIAKAESSATPPTAKELTYNGDAQELVTAGSATGGVMKYALGDAAQATADYGDAILEGTDAGTYYVWYKAVGDANHNDTVPGQVAVTIAQAAATVTAPTAKTPLTYNGAAQELITAGNVTSDVPGCGTMWYSLEAEGGFSAEIPTGEDAQEYTVYWTVDGADQTNYHYVGGTSGEVSVIIAQAAAQITMPPAARDLTYTGEEQALVTAGESSFGALAYSLDDPEGPFAAAIPAATEAGLYTVYYMAEGSDNWTASPVGSVQVEIHPADSSATVRRRTGLVYSGQAQALVTANEVTGGELVYALGADAELVPASGYEGRTPTATDAGTYYVWWKILGDVDHGDTEPACLTVTIAPFPLTLEPVAAETPYTGAAISVPVTQTAGQTPAIDPEKIAVSYEQDGAAAEPVLPGTYDVLVAVTDPNFTLAGTAKVGTLTITHVHVYGEEWAHDESNHWHVCQGVGPCDAPRSDLAAHQLTWVDDGDGTGHQVCAVCGYTTGEHTHASDAWRVDEENVQHYKICDACGAAFDRAAHALTWVAADPALHWQACAVCGWAGEKTAHVWDGGVVTQAPTVEAEGSRLYTCAVCGATRSEPISKLDTFQISGAVTDQAGAPLTRAAVRLTRGQETVAETVTDDQGRYSFSSVPAGLYNVAATWEDVTKTILVELSDADAGQRDIQMPSGRVSSVVEVLGEDTPDVVVGGVDAIAEAEATSPAETVTVTLTVAKQEEPTDKEEIDRLVAGQKDDVLYLDVSLLKQINTQPTQAITDTGVRVLEIVVPYDFTGKRSVTVYRKHGDDPAAALTALSARPDLAAAEDGTFFADEENGWIAIYASKFSTYAIGYQTAATSSSSVARYVLTATAGEGGTIDPAGAIRVRRGADQSYAIHPEAGYAVADVLVDGVSVGAVTAYTFENVAAAHTIQAIFQKAGESADGLPFSDVAPGDWFYDSVRDVYQRGLMVGVDSSRFAPAQGATRATVVTILWRLAGSPAARAGLAYADVGGDAWYAQAVRWADETGVAIGYGDGRFGPDDPITREQLAVMLWRYAAAQGRDVSVGEDANILSYQDFDQIGDWAIPGLQWAAGSGVLRGAGSGATLSPKAVATRAELATVLARYCGAATLKETNEEG